MFTFLILYSEFDNIKGYKLKRIIIQLIYLEIGKLETYT